MSEASRMAEDMPKASVATEPALPDVPAKRRSWDFALTAVTMGLLGSLGVQSFAGTIYAWWGYRSIPGFETLVYPDFISVMNLIAAPQVVALVVAMGLCVPKRLFSRRALVTVSAGMLAAGGVVASASGSLADGLAAYLALAGLIQLAVVAMTVVGTRGPSYLTEGRLTKLGSGLLHLGFIGFAIVVVALQRSSLMLPAFWVSTILMMVGTTLSFYAGPTRRLIRERLAR